MQIARKSFKNHVDNECETRIVECEYKKYGCTAQNLKANQLKQHMDDFQFDHLSFKVSKLEQQLQVTQQIMPQGSIVMWSGTINNIPDGWMLCDGNNDTPDLRNRFIIGASDDHKLNSTGGNKQHSHHITVHGHRLTGNEMPSHSHNIPGQWNNSNGDI
eukprot:UN06382